MRIPDSDDTSRLLAVIPLRSPFGQRDHAMIRLDFHTGLRVSELVGLNVGHVWFQGAPRRWIDLDPSTCKYHKGRQIPINSVAQQAITDLIRFLQARGFATGPDDPLLTDRRHRRLPVREVQRCVQKYRELAGLDLRVTPHTCRHVFASELIQKGASAYEVKELLGHEEIRTSQVYVHNHPKKLAAAVHRLVPKLPSSRRHDLQAAVGAG